MRAGVFLRDEFGFFFGFLSLTKPPGTCEKTNVILDKWGFGVAVDLGRSPLFRVFLGPWVFGCLGISWELGFSIPRSLHK